MLLVKIFNNINFIVYQYKKKSHRTRTKVQKDLKRKEKGKHKQTYEDK